MGKKGKRQSTNKQQQTTDDDNGDENGFASSALHPPPSLPLSLPPSAHLPLVVGKKAKRKKNGVARDADPPDSPQCALDRQKENEGAALPSSASGKGSSVANDSDSSLLCAVCATPGSLAAAGLLCCPCGVKYCSKECQANDWKEHRVEHGERMERKER